MITAKGFTYELLKFPVGETHVRIKYADLVPGLLWEYENNEEIMEILLLVDAMKRRFTPLKYLQMPYVPYGRQDRIAEEGEPLSIAVLAGLINSCGFGSVYIDDPHSDVTPALLDRCVVREQWEIFLPYFKGISNFWLLSPDAGALKKIHKLAAKVDCLGVIECSKVRDTKTGRITDVHVPRKIEPGQSGYVVDDLCDGGLTFLALAAQIPVEPSRLHLMVTHGFFTRGLSELQRAYGSITTNKGTIEYERDSSASA